MSDAYETFFEELLPKVDRIVREHDELAPVLVVKSMHGQQAVIPVGMLFQSAATKDLVVEGVQALFQHPDTALVALISECWLKQFDAGVSKEAGEAAVDEAGGVRNMPDKIEGVIIQIYGRDREDRLFTLRTKPDRAGVERWMDKADHYEGRFVRDTPDRSN